MLQGHKVVLMFGGQSQESERFNHANNHNRQQNMKLITTRILSVSTIQVIASLALAVVLFIASIPEFLNTLTPGIFLTVVFCMLTLLKPLKQLTTVNSELQRGLAACKSIFEVLDQATEQDNGKKTVTKARGHVSFDKVSFSYPSGNSLALDNVSFDVPAGSTLALVGPSGSGKSTVSNLLTRFYNASEGQVTLDGETISEIPLSDLRAQFALVSQHVVLFNDTIANNIAYACGQTVTRKQIEAAAKAAHVLEFVEHLDNGLDTVIGESGFNLSGGQRQRIAIARAILRDAPILVLDEATSALDTESERLIQQALEVLQQDKTCIVIAHRLSTIESADNILVVERGKVVESGTHNQLLSLNGAYSQLHQMQFGGQ
jgi:subfamily B ATP-binding cassette protein MsbA